LWKMLEQDARLKVKDIARAELFVEPETTGPVPFWWGAAVKFNGKTAEKTARTVLDVGAGDRVRFVPGQRIPFLESPRYKFTDSEFWGAAVVDPSVAVFGPRRLVWQTLSPGNKVTPIAAAMEYLDPDHDLALAVAPEPLAKFLDRVNARRRAGDKDEAVELAARVAGKLSAAVGYVDINKPTLVRVEFHLLDAGSADEVKAGVEAGLTALRAAWPELRKQLLGTGDAAAGKALLAALDAAVTTAKVDVKNKAVVVTVPRPADWPPK
jgi:hypothetical protein